MAWKRGGKGITVYRAGSIDKEVLVKGTEHDTKQLPLFNMEPINNPSIEVKCCDNPYIIKESGWETCKSCGYSACLIA